MRKQRPNQRGPPGWERSFVRTVILVVVGHERTDHRPRGDDRAHGVEHGAVPGGALGRWYRGPSLPDGPAQCALGVAHPTSVPARVGA